MGLQAGVPAVVALLVVHAQPEFVAGAVPHATEVFHVERGLVRLT